MAPANCRAMISAERPAKTATTARIQIARGRPSTVHPFGKRTETAQGYVAARFGAQCSFRPASLPMNGRLVVSLSLRDMTPAPSAAALCARRLYQRPVDLFGHAG